MPLLHIVLDLGDMLQDMCPRSNRILSQERRQIIDGFRNATNCSGVDYGLAKLQTTATDADSYRAKHMQIQPVGFFRKLSMTVGPGSWEMSVPLLLGMLSYFRPG